MRPRRLLRFHALKRPKVRQTWNKYNLYNLSRMRIPERLVHKTYFQQKWFAKAMARTYHGEHINEKRWERMFDRRLPSVVNMHPAYMAKYNGSEQAAGRGSGREELPEPEGFKREDTNAPSTKRTPYMQMMFTPQERRLDIAIFRALFASSARQARQFVVHGAVKVNGLKMQYPAYLLNPGDMFQVDVEKVLLATGKTKSRNAPSEPLGLSQRLHLRRQLADLRAANPERQEEQEAVGEKPQAVEAGEKKPEAMEAGEEKLKEREAPEAGVKKPKEREASEETLEEIQKKKEAALAETVKAEAAQLKKIFTRLREMAKLEIQKLSAKKKQDLRALTKQVKRTRSLVDKQKPFALRSPGLIAEMQVELEKLEEATLSEKEKAKKEKEKAADAAASNKAKQGALAGPLANDVEELDERDMKVKKLEKELEALRIEALHNPYDPKKPYATPWRPRPYMAPFAFIPRYLEVNQKICAAVYLRHPVARQGSGEVPTPYPLELSQLAFNWYLRRS